MGAATRRVVYLDHAATTPLRAEVLEAMMPWLTSRYGNPSGAHSVGQAARRATDDAREVIAAALAGEPGEVVFTSGGTEADNLAVAGAAAAAAASAHVPVAMASTAIEHPAVFEPMRAAHGTEIPVGIDGVLDLGYLEEWLLANAGDVALVSVMLVNNETGLVQPLATATGLVRERSPQALVHTDAVQAFPWLDLATASPMGTGAGAGAGVTASAGVAAADLVTISAHKFGGPKGAGALLVRGTARSKLHPLLRGGPQERELRAGTPDVAAIVGMSEAARLACAERDAVVRAVDELADRFVAAVLSAVESCGVAVAREKRIGAICNLWFEGVESEELLIVLDELGVCASAGSSCASGALEPSHVLTAMGRSREEARSHVRFSFGRASTPEDVDLAVAAVIQAVARLRANR
jgi:cysteine desulfurase